MKRRPTVRGTWLLAMAAFLAIVAALAAVSIVSTSRHAAAVDAAAAHFRRQAGLRAELQADFLTAEASIGPILYDLDRDVLTEHELVYGALQREIDRKLTELGAGPHVFAEPLLREVTSSWQQAVRGIEQAAEKGSPAEVLDQLAAGEDVYFDTVWAPLARAQAALAELASANASHFQEHLAAVDEARRSLTPAYLAAIAVTLLVAFAVMRRLSLTAVQPLGGLRDRAAAIRDGRPVVADRLPSTAGAELVELAVTMDEMAASLAETHARLEAQAQTDSLTGIANRRHFAEQIASAMDRRDEEPLALVLIDLDGFKLVNDSMGHHVGDQLLVSVARLIAAETRTDDLTARLGGDEFAVLVTGPDALAAATAIGHRIAAKLDGEVDIAGRRVRSGCSVGVAAPCPATTTADSLIHNADAALYVAKNDPARRVHVFSAEDHAILADQAELQRDLAVAVDRRQLELHFQPVVDLETQRPLGLEALVRWRHPKRGLVPPGEFIGLAEQTGRIADIGAWVLDEACATLARLQSEFDDPLWVSVNVSPQQLCEGFVDLVLASVRGHGINPSALLVELTEAAMMPDRLAAAGVLSQLRREGVRVALDDFGTGHSSLSRLHALPVDVVKIDRSFVQDDDAACDRRYIVEAIVAMARGLGAQLVAEGVEEPEQLDRLRPFGPLGVQGFLIARPVPASDIVEFLARWQASARRTAAPAPGSPVR